MADDAPGPPGGMHRLIVEALGDEEALSQLGPDGYLAPAPWGAALERVRARRHGNLPLADGHRAVGRELAAAFLASPAGQLVAATLPQLELERAFSSVLMPMADRMRRAFEYDFVPSPEGGRIRIRGARVANVQNIAGFFEEMLARIPGRYALHIVREEPGLLELGVTRAG